MLEKIAKKIVFIFGIIILLILNIVNLFSIATVENFSEHVLIENTTSIQLTTVIVTAIALILLIRRLSASRFKINNKIIIGIAIIIYIIVSLIWINKARSNSC